MTFDLILTLSIVCVIIFNIIIWIDTYRKINEIGKSIKENFITSNSKHNKILNTLESIEDGILDDTDKIIKQNNIINSYCDKINKQLDTISKVTDSTNNRVKSMQNKAKNSLHNTKMNNSSLNINKTNTKLKTAEK